MSARYDEVIPIIILRGTGAHGILLEEGAHVSKVRYMWEGHEIVEYVGNDDFIQVDAIVIEHIEE